MIEYPTLPADVATATAVQGSGGVTLAFYELVTGAAAGREAAPALIWGHANGFAAGSYRPLLEAFAEDFRVFSWDARGQGGSSEPAAPLSVGCHGDAHAHDLAIVAGLVREKVGPGVPIHFAGHSFSGYAAMRLGGVHGRGEWTSCTLFEPPLCPTPDLAVHAPAMDLARGLIGGAERRRRRWDSVEAFRESLLKRPYYQRWRREMLDAHTAATLRAAPEGDCVLACPPEVEAAVYRMTLDTSTFRALVHVPFPVRFVASETAGSDMPPSWASRAQKPASERVPEGRYTHMADTTHMMVFERPGEVRDIVMDEIGLRTGAA